MLESQVMDRLLHALVKIGRVEITDWKGEIHRYGKSGPEVEVIVRDPRILRRLLVNPSLTIGEAYMDGSLVIPEDQLPTFFELVARNRSHYAKFQLPVRRSTNRKAKQRAQISHHYDVGNDYYRLFLDSRLNYSCAYFKHEDDSLEDAQQQKITYLLRKLRLAPGQRLLDIGCGWGHLAVTAAQQYPDVAVLGITLSEEQLTSARDLAQRKGVSDRVKFELMNYSDMKEHERFHRIISVGMFEHVGRRNRDDYFRKVRQLLAPEGVSVLHTITQQFDKPADPWVDRYIFPGGHLPTLAGIEQSLSRHGLWSIDCENLWQHYALTLWHWRMRHQSNRAEIISMFDERFYRMRDFWLAGSWAGFRYGRLGLSQVIFSKGKLVSWPLTREYQFLS